MRFMVMHKMTEEMEKGRPDPEIIAAVGAMIGDIARDGRFVSGEGLKPTATRLRIAYRGGKRTVAEAAGRTELIAGLSLLKVRSRDEALACCDELAEALGDVELLLGPVNETWDIGLAPVPVDPPLRLLLLPLADQRSESDLPLDAQRTAKLAAVVDRMTKAGVLQATGQLASTKQGARIRFDGGKRKVIDGPFAESKELIAGYAILDLPSKEAAIEQAIRFGEIVRVLEVDVRRVIDRA